MLPAAATVLAGLVPLVLLCVGVVGLVRRVPRVRRALPAEGVLVRAVDAGGQQPYASWRLTVEFVDAGGVRRTATGDTASSSDRSTYRPGVTVPVRYDPQDPSWVWFPGGGRQHPVVVPALLVAIGTVAAAVLLVLR